MDQDMLAALALPLVFSMLAGGYAYRTFPERRPKVLLALILIQLVSACGYRMEPGLALLELLIVYSAVLFFLLLDYVQAPVLATEGTRH